VPSNPERSGDLLSKALARGANCPPLEKLEPLADAAHGGGGDVARHVETCSYCQTELELLKTFQRAEIQQNDAAAVQQIARRLHERSPEIFAGRPSKERKSFWDSIFGVRWLAPGAVAVAALLLVVAVGLQLQRSAAPSLGRGNGGGEVMRSGSIRLLAPVGDLTEAPAEIRWEPTASAVRYRVHILEVDHTELWKADVAESHVALPENIRAQVVPAKTLLCQVQAFDQNGNLTGESDFSHFRLLQKIYTH
jgi:hypothetical protein